MTSQNKALALYVWKCSDCQSTGIPVKRRWAQRFGIRHRRQSAMLRVDNPMGPHEVSIHPWANPNWAKSLWLLTARLRRTRRAA